MPELEPGRILLAENDPLVGRSLLAFLSERGHEVAWANDGETAFNLLDGRPFDALVTELHLGRAEGMRLLRVARERNPDICAVFLLEHADIDLATAAMREGAYDFQLKPVNRDKLELVIERGLAHQRLLLEQVELKRRLDQRFGLGSLVGRSRAMVQVYNAVRNLGPTRETVLLFGAAGTGKDLVAQAIHNNSPRRDEPFVKLDCSGLPEHVVRKELFGAPQAKSRFELADGGTLFLEGIHSLPPPLQEKLLETLGQGAVPRPGGGKPVPVDTRLIAATARRLEVLVAEGAFRRDLWNRLRTTVLEVPALRTRRDDIPLLLQHALHEAAQRHATAARGFTSNALDVLTRYDWPDNLRELALVVEGMAANAQGEILGVNHIPRHIRQQVRPGGSELRIPLGASMRDIERAAIEETMRYCGQNKEKCAKTLGIGLRTLYRKLKSYEIE